MDLSTIDTPALVLDCERLDANLARMQTQMQRLGVRLRPHMKTAKSIDVARRLGREPGPITVSTLKEAEYFAEQGYTDILYAIGISPDKLDQVGRLRARGIDLKIILDDVEAARAVVAWIDANRVTLPTLIEIDSDGHRAGVDANGTLLIDIGRLLASCSALAGVMTHAGASYDCRSEAALREMAEIERSATVLAAKRLRDAGLAVAIVSVGSTPTALFARSAAGVTEVRAGVYMFFDLVMAGIGVCRPHEIALSVLATVIGHRRDKGWLLVDAGWMALSRDRGTATQPFDMGYGAVCDINGRMLEGLIVAQTNQEHGIIADAGAPNETPMLPIGSRLRILPNHACATAAQHDRYHVVRGSALELVAQWSRFSGW